MNKSKSMSWKILTVAAMGFFFNHAAVAQEAAVTEPTAGYDKGFFVKSGNDFLLKANGRMQTRAEYKFAKERKDQHDVRFTLPAARLLFSGNVFDPQIGFGSQFAADNGFFRVIEFYGNFGLLPDDLGLKVGHFLGNYSLLETNSAGKLEFTDRASLHSVWKLDSVTGFSFHRNKKKPIIWELAVFNAGKSKFSDKYLGGVSGNIGFNYNELDASDEVDFDGGPFRFLFNVGGFARTRLDTWKIVGYAGAAEAMTKFNHASISAGFFTGVPEAPLSPTSTPTSLVQELNKDQIGFGGYGRAGYVFDDRFGFGARYALQGDFKGGTMVHEIFAATSFYFLKHNLKTQLEGGTAIVEKTVSPQVRVQLQLAF